MAKVIYQAPLDPRLLAEIARLRRQVRELQAEVERLQTRSVDAVALDEAELADILSQPALA
jgi:phage shock protein A